MNKPKHMKRWKPTPGPSGSIGVVHAVPDEFATALGHLLVAFALLEDEYASLLGRILGISDGTDRYIFHNLQAAQRTKVLKAVLQESPAARAAPAAFDRVIDEFERLRNLRNAWAHGMWMTRNDGSVTVAKGAPEVLAYLQSAEEARVSDILSARDACLNLYLSIQQLPWKRADAGGS